MTKRTHPITQIERAESLHMRAHAQWEHGSRHAAFRLMLAAAKAGDPGAMTNIGYFYDCGIGVRPNRNSALSWYRKSYRHGNAGAANNIGVIYRDKKNWTRALAWFRRSVALGDIEANLEIAKVHFNHFGNAERALPYLKHVLKAKAKVEVTVSGYDEARKLLRRLSLKADPGQS